MGWIDHLASRMEQERASGADAPLLEGRIIGNNDGFYEAEL